MKERIQVGPGLLVAALAAAGLGVLLGLYNAGISPYMRATGLGTAMMFLLALAVFRYSVEEKGSEEVVRASGVALLLYGIAFVALLITMGIVVN